MVKINSNHAIQTTGDLYLLLIKGYYTTVQNMKGMFSFNLAIPVEFWHLNESCHAQWPLWKKEARIQKVDSLDYCIKVQKCHRRIIFLYTSTSEILFTDFSTWGKSDKMKYPSWTLLIHFHKAHSKTGKSKNHLYSAIVLPIEIKWYRMCYCLSLFFS